MHNSEITVAIDEPRVQSVLQIALTVAKFIVVFRFMAKYRVPMAPKIFEYWLKSNKKCVVRKQYCRKRANILFAFYCSIFATIPTDYLFIFRYVMPSAIEIYWQRMNRQK